MQKLKEKEDVVEIQAVKNWAELSLSILITTCLAGGDKD